MLPNSILKKIYICNQKEKIISRSFLLKLFKSQIGYPKSLAQLNSALSSIMRWYSHKGYQWALIQMHYIEGSSSIIVNIDEGLISTIRTEYYTSSLERSSKSSYTNMIEKHLSIRIGHPINIIYLKRKINYLKKNKLVGNIIYSVERSRNNSSHLDLKFQIQELQDKELVLFGENLYKTSYVIAFLSHLLQEPLYLANSWETYNIDQMSANRFKLHYYQPICNYQYINNKELADILIYLFSKSTFQHIKNSRFNPLLNCDGETTSRCKLYLRNLSNASSYFTVSMHSLENTINLKLRYLNPSLRISKKFTIQVVIQIIKKIASSCIFPSSIFLKNQKIFGQKFTNQYIFEGLMTYNITSCFSMSEKIFLSRNVQTKYFVKNLQTVKFISTTKALIGSNDHWLKKQSKLLYRQFLVLWLKLYYQNFDTLKWPTKGHLLEIESCYFTPFQESTFLNYHSQFHYNNLFFHKINIQHITHFSLPFYFQSRINYILRNVLKVQSNLKMETLPILLCRAYFEDKVCKPFFNFSIRIRTEYQVPINNKSRISFFCNYIRPFLKNSYQTCIIFQSSLINQKFISSLYQKLFYGLEIQLKLPINQIPPLSIEYTINSGRKFCIYLYISHQQ
uniref:Uncharacterized protein ORF621 n=1 Tax=Porphyra purpurea TaxID=2787 RepID=YCXB_PORPU|nr:hypothetical protein PopuCp049 [Porphyra purpurea]P51234.1 RecName: Full=Uncharacterized protein ORF621 [Porphyra purpurea]AAC08120.1 ORF621 [Porphyra purpurea]